LLSRRNGKSIHRIDFHITSKYDITRLVYFEIYNSAEGAITREKFVKKLKRARRVKLIKTDIPDWQELYKGDQTIPW